MASLLGVKPDTSAARSFAWSPRPKNQVDDDDQVVELTVTKKIDRENPRAEVTIEKDLLCNSRT